MAISPQRLTIYLYSAHRAVIFAIAQLSCSFMLQSHYSYVEKNANGVETISLKLSQAVSVSVLFCSDLLSRRIVEISFLPTLSVTTSFMIR